MVEIVLGVVTAIVLADWISGFWHWLEDRYFEESWPLIGQYIAKPNTLHHAQPTAFLKQGYWSRNWTTLLPAATAVLIAYLCGAPWWIHLALVVVSQANEIHAWAHVRVQNRWIRGLQEFGLLQSPRHHNVHHKDPFSRNYCVITDWLNPILDRTRFWFAAEFLVEKLLGLPIRMECREMDARAVLKE